jgi:hypothetical protein
MTFGGLLSSGDKKNRNFTKTERDEKRCVDYYVINTQEQHTKLHQDKICKTNRCKDNKTVKQKDKFDGTLRLERWFGQ